MGRRRLRCTSVDWSFAWVGDTRHLMSYLSIISSLLGAVGVSLHNLGNYIYISPFFFKKFQGPGSVSFNSTTSPPSSCFWVLAGPICLGGVSLWSGLRRRICCRRPKIRSLMGVGTAMPCSLDGDGGWIPERMGGRAEGSRSGLGGHGFGDVAVVVGLLGYCAGPSEEVRDEQRETAIENAGRV
ncbi:hypothetical protein BO71DRAFT_223024 [Aspergillus ellipticus CBS 707.79]|uniref:Uncharacterized protein n=1 Tax=Aspergillus ellipticus CBS 707.79 TaxID=1448320 RepID=A0A319DNV6_9EURO|nr:hypothetical protein BO71DRAFT_223024 [Aspergillus ellipticus CBS 707.79]